jgi:hypothetical protein
VKIQKSVRETYTGEVLWRELQTEFGRVLARRPRQHFVADLLDVLRAALYLLIFVPAYVLASLAFAAAFYVRLSGALLVD